MPPIRILYVMDALHDARSGGTERQFTHLLEHLDRRRFAPHLAVFRPTRFTEQSGPCCPVESLAIRKLAHPATPLRLLRLAAAIRTGGFRVAHVFFNDASVVAPPFCRLGGAQVVVSRRDMGFWYTPALLRLLRVSNRFVARMIVNSGAVRDNVARCERYPVRKTDVLPNGLDPAAFDAAPLEGFRQRFGIADDAPIVGMVAHFHRWKRQADLVRAFAEIHPANPAAHLVFVGAGECEEEVRRLCPPHLLRFIHFAGAADDVVPLMKHFTAGVLCSDSEGSSNVVMEYLACGLPVVCTNVGGNRELVGEGRTGFLVAPGDTHALAARLNVLLANPRRASEMGRNAHADAGRFSLRTMVERHMALYDSLAGARALPC